MQKCSGWLLLQKSNQHGNNYMLRLRHIKVKTPQGWLTGSALQLGKVLCQQTNQNRAKLFFSLSEQEEEESKKPAMQFTTDTQFIWLLSHTSVFFYNIRFPSMSVHFIGQRDNQ